MAGDWIKMRGNLWDDPRIGRLVDMTDTSEAAVIGGLYWLWAAADQHTEDGLMPGLSLRQIDRKTGIKGLGQALVDIGWIADHADAISIIKFEEHNGTSAKKRCQTAKRVSSYRAGNADVTQPALQESDASVSDALAREREEKDISPSLRSGESAETAPTPSAEKQNKAKTLTAYLEGCKAAKTKPIPDGHSLRTWATEAGITAEMLQIAWVQFRERYTEAEKGRGKRYKDWPGHFATAIKNNWFKLWFLGDSGMQWSSTGLTHKTVLDARMAQKEVEHA
jgi:hypothetical protein